MPQALWQNATTSLANTVVIQSYSEVGREQPQISLFLPQNTALALQPPYLT